MKRLTLMRHADARWKDSGVSDLERPLNRRGARTRRPWRAAWPRAGWCRS